MAELNKWYRPKKDITAYELAVIYGKLTLAISGGFGGGLTRAISYEPVIFERKDWDEIAPEIQRHFEDAT